MRFWFNDVGSSETQMCRLARVFAVCIMKPNVPFEPAHSHRLPVPSPLGGRGEQRDIIVFVPHFPLNIWPWYKFPFSPSPKPLGEPQILVPIILTGTMMTQACMIFLRLTPFWSNYYRYLDFCWFFQRKQIRDDLRHKTNFRFLVNGRSKIIAGEQIYYWGTS